MDCSELIHEWVVKTGALFRLGGPRHIGSFAHGEMFILKYLADREGDDTVQPSDLSAALKASSARIAMALGRLEKKQLVKRTVDPSDRRKVIVSITPDGIRETERFKAQMHEKMAYLLGELGEADVREYLRIVGRIIDIARRYEDSRKKEEDT